MPYLDSISVLISLNCSFKVDTYEEANDGETAIWKGSFWTQCLFPVPYYSREDSDLLSPLPPAAQSFW